MTTWATPIEPATVGGAPLLVRPRLVERLRQGSRQRLTLLTAPAGYGKTVLVNQWLERHEGWPVARLVLDPDDDPSGLARRFGAALRGLGARVRPVLPERVRDGTAIFGARFLTGLSSELASLGDAVLVVDPVDTRADPAFIAALVTLIERAPPNLHVVATRRSGYPRSLDVFRSRHDVMWLDESDLAFTHDEARRLVRDVAGLELSDDRLESLMARTDGWPAALHLTALELRNGADADEVIAAVSGADPHVAALLSERVLGDQSARVRRFLVRTSVLDRLSGPLCDEVTGEPSSAMMLRLLAHLGVFTRPLDVGGDWFSYHRLFREFLRHELRLSDPAAESEMLGRAAAWHAGRGEPEQAARYLIEAGRWEELLRLVTRFGVSMFEKGAAVEVLEWLKAVPHGVDAAMHQLELSRAYLHSMLGETRRAAQVVHGLDRAGLSTGERAAVEALRASWVFFDATPDRAIRAADGALAALEGLGADDVPDVLGMTSPENLRTMAVGSHARAVWLAGDVAAGRRELTAVARQERAYPPWRTHALSALALLEAWAGNAGAAHRHAHHSLNVAARAGLLSHPATLDARLALASVARERGDVRRAWRLIRTVDSIAARTRRPLTDAILTVERALLHLTSGHPDRGLAEIERNRTNGAPPPQRLIDVRLREVELCLLVASGDAARARAVLDRVPRPLPAELRAVVVRIAVADHDLDGAQASLASWDPDGLEPRGRMERGLWEAIVEFEFGNRRPALQRAAAVAEAAWAQRRVRLFADAGRPAERLLRALLHAAPTPSVAELARAAIPARPDTEGGAVPELSDRELDVVRYLPTRLSNAEIAAQLYISLNTLKTHLRTIYRKLGVTRRDDAIRRAEELGLA
jgi:LuxR family maltose regulon positive regulatory protein